MSERYQGGYITASVINPNGQMDAVATGVWSLMEQFTFHKAALWPNKSSKAIFGGGAHAPAVAHYQDEDNFGNISNYYDVMDFVNIASTGNATDFGNLTISKFGTGCVGSATRACFAGGYVSSPAGTATNVIEFVTIDTAGNGADFGDTSLTRAQMCGGVSSTTRGCFAAGLGSGGNKDTIDFITIASAGNATDFGNLTEGQDQGLGGFCSPTRGVWGGGMPGGPAGSNVIAYITIASAGNATDFGDLSATHGPGVCGCSSNLRGIFMHDDLMEYVTIASTGNVTDFGDPSVNRYLSGGASNNTRGIFGGGWSASLEQSTNIVDHVTIASTGNAADFGDLTQGRVYVSATGNNHGGLQ
jgi:hypothetical protein